jgi:peroxiredoxin
VKQLWGKLAAAGIIVGAILVVWAAWPAGPQSQPASSLTTAVVTQAKTADHGLVGQQMPAVTLPDVNGAQHNLTDYKGKTLILAFWTSWCDTCKQELAVLQEMYPEWQKRGDVSLLTVDFGETAATVKATIEERAYTFPILVDEKGAAMAKYQVFYRPATFIIAPDGKIKRLVVGPVSQEDWTALLSKE